MIRTDIKPGDFSQELINILSCPCCGHTSFNYEPSNFIQCSNVSCYAHQHLFEMVRNQPLLIDFRSGLFEKQNFLNHRDGEVVIRKKSKASIIIKRFLWGDSPVSSTQVSKIISFVEEKNVPVKLLVVGGGTIGLGTTALYTHPLITVISFDVYLSGNTHFVADAHAIPIKNGAIDIVIVQAVLEHVLNPPKVVLEIYRVLKIGGLVYAETPFMQQVHEGAYDFTRFTESGQRWLFSNFELIDSGAVRGAGVSLLWAIRYFFTGIFRSKAAGAFAAACFFWLRFVEKLIPKNYNIDAGSCFYFLGVKTGTAIRQKEIVAFYNRQ